MRSKFRLLAACLLMVLLPLQSFAAMAGAGAACAMHETPAGDCCEGGHQAGPAHDHSQDGKAGMQCDMGMNCPAFALATLPQAAPALPLDLGRARQHAAADLRFTSHIPEGLQRPPRFSV